MNNIQYLPKQCTTKPDGLVCVIDVLRAFTTSAIVLAKGAQKIILVSELDHAFELKKQDKNLILIGEDRGLPVKGFDYSNSPYEVSKLNFKHKTIVQRTSNGTQGVINYKDASVLLVASAMNALSTAEYIRSSKHNNISFIITNDFNSEEDKACADLIVEYLNEKNPCLDQYKKKIKNSSAGKIFSNPIWKDFPKADLDLACQFNQYDFVMQVKKIGSLFCLSTFK